MVLIKKGNVAVFCSGGEGNLPEFVCESEERADELIDYFDRMKKTTSSMLMFPQTKVGRAEEVARDFSDKGLYYFDADDGTKLGICTFHEYYTKSHNTLPKVLPLQNLHLLPLPF